MNIDMLSASSVPRILRVAHGECVRQNVDFRSLVDLLSAYEVAAFASDKLPDEHIIMRLGQLIDPAMNEYGYRQTAVTFQNGSGATDWRNIPYAMNMLVACVSWIEPDDVRLRDEDINEWIKTFLHIHPFRDGNGRCAWLLYNWLKGTLDYPLPLPEYQF